MRILIGADLVPTQTNVDLFATGDVRALVGEELYQLLRKADYRIFNLEVPLTDKATPILKNGPSLIAPTKCIAAYKAMQVDLLTLANNHILDQEQQGLESTIRVLESAGISYTGVGRTPAEAAQPHIFECDGKKIGVYACAEHEFSIVTDSTPGANPIDFLESPDHVAALKAQCDFVIVLYHGGKEHYRYPSPNLQKVCRKLVEKGAGLVLCQHSHCIGCEEKYKGSTIVYGQGNFLFDHRENEYWQTGVLVQIGNDFSIEYIPIEKDGRSVRAANCDEAQTTMSSFQQRSLEITDNTEVKNKYMQFASQNQTSYLCVLSGMRRKVLFRIVNKLSRFKFARWFVNHWYSKRDMLAVQDYIQCESHKELMLMGLQQNAYKE